MSISNPVKALKNVKLKKFLQNNLSKIVEEVQEERKFLAALPIVDKPLAVAQKSLAALMSLRFLKPDNDWGAVTKRVRAAVWKVCCQIDNGKGKPKDEVVEAFDKDGPGTKLVETAVAAAFITKEIASSRPNLLKTSQNALFGRIIGLDSSFLLIFSGSKG